MKLKLITFLLLFASSIYAQKTKKLKNEVIKSLNDESSKLIRISDAIWEAAEIAFQESLSSQALIKYAKDNGFNVEEVVANTPTAFIASYGSGSPVIGILGEFDALPGLSQKTSSNKDPIIEGAPGHGCGHNLFGTASLGAAISIKKLI